MGTSGFDFEGENMGGIERRELMKVATVGGVALSISGA
jgi:hypothetical protein